MDTVELFLASDAALRSVVDRIDPADLDRPAPQVLSSAPDPTFRDVLAAQAYDEAWVPGVVAGRSAADGDDLKDTDLLGADPVGAYGALNDAAVAAVRGGVEPGSVFRFSYGDVPAEEGLAHLATYRAFQAWLVARHLGIPFRLSPELVAGLEEHVLPQARDGRPRSRAGRPPRAAAVRRRRRRDAAAGLGHRLPQEASTGRPGPTGPARPRPPPRRPVGSRRRQRA